MTKTTASILQERQNTDTAPIDRDLPRRPVINLFAPGMTHAFDGLQAPNGVDQEEKKRFRSAKKLLEQQRGYSFQVATGFDRAAFQEAGSEELSPHPLITMRAMELRLATASMAGLAASELSATLRLPNDINRTSGAVRQLADHYRSRNTSDRKRLETLRRVQSRLAEAVPSDFVNILKETEGDIRIVADAHLEWLDIEGLPLGLRKNVSRIPVTPGNLFVEQTGASPPIRLVPEDFNKILLISALKRDDPINAMFESALEVSNPVWRDEISLQVVEVGSEDELVEALNAYDGPLLMFDGHGSHRPDGPALLHLQDASCDVWTLRGRARVPPIVFLSACDTHAANRNHETTANGFLSLGARSVLGSVFPLLAKDAAIFAARLLHRLAKFVPAAINTRGRAITWTDVVSGLLRMQLLTDFLRRLEQRNEISHATYEEIHIAGNMAINTNQIDPFANVISLLIAKGVDAQKIKLVLEIAVANSSTLSYLNVGRPETILLDTLERLKGAENALRASDANNPLIASSISV